MQMRRALTTLAVLLVTAIKATLEKAKLQVAVALVCILTLFIRLYLFIYLFICFICFSLDE